MTDLPEVIELSPDAVTLRLSPNEMRMVRDATGKPLDELLGEGADQADVMQTIAWMKLRRDGHPDVTWDEVGDVRLEFQTPDPTSGEPSTSSPPSAGSGE